MASVVEHEGALIDGTPGMGFKHGLVPAARRHTVSTVGAIWSGFPMVLTGCSRVPLGSVVDSKHTLSASISKAIMKGQG